jgi:type VI protein secretion system component VasK
MEPEKKSHGALIGSIIIIVILIIGGIYVWQSRIKDLKMKEQLQAEAINALTSDELNKLEEEIGTIDTTTDLDTSTIQ